MEFNIDKVVFFLISVMMGMFSYSLFGFEPTIIVILLFIIAKMRN
jgi:hypothetical protein